MVYARGEVNKIKSVEERKIRFPFVSRFDFLLDFFFTLFLLFVFFSSYQLN